MKHLNISNIWPALLLTDMQMRRVDAFPPLKSRSALNKRLHSLYLDLNLVHRSIAGAIPGNIGGDKKNKKKKELTATQEHLWVALAILQYSQVDIT